MSNEIEGKRYVTTTEVLSEEKRVVDLVRHGVGQYEKNRAGSGLGNPTGVVEQ